MGIREDFSKFIASQQFKGFGDIPQGGVRRVRHTTTLSRRARHQESGEIRTILHPDIRSIFESHTKNILFLKRGWFASLVAVGVTPVKVVRSSTIRSYSIFNPSGSASGNQPSLADQWEDVITANASGDNTATPMEISNYLYLQLHCSVIAVTGSWTFYAQSSNPATGGFADCAKLWTGVDAPEELFSNQEGFPISSIRAIRWTMDTPGVISFQLGYTAKQFVGGAPGGISQTLYLGPNDGVSIVSGYPLPEGSSFNFIVDENVEVWGVAETPISVNVFEF